jgi:integrase
MFNVAGLFVAGTLAESVGSLVEHQTTKLPHRELANIHSAEPVLASTPVTPSTASTGGKTVPRRRFQRGTLIIRGKKPMRCGIYREDVLQSNGTFKRVQRCVVLGPAGSLSERAAWKVFQPHLDRVNADLKLPPKSGKTLEQFVQEWRSNVAVNLKGSTTRAAESHLRAHIIPKLGSLSLTEINTKTVQGFVAYLATGGRSRKTVENVLLTLSSILRVAKAWDYACGNFSLADITLPREGIKKEQRSFTDEEAGKIIAAAPEPFSTILAVTAVLGLRIGEVLALRVSDLDFARKVICVRQSVDSATRLPQAVKSQASSADVPMPTQLETRLRAHLLKHDGKSELLFANRKGRPFSANKLREKQLHPLLVKLGVPRGGFHSMRHGAASSLLADGATPAVVQKQLRHSDPRITLGIYGHVVGNQQRDAVEHRSARIAKYGVN